MKEVWVRDLSGKRTLCKLLEVDGNFVRVKWPGIGGWFGLSREMVELPSGFPWRFVPTDGD